MMMSLGQIIAMTYSLKEQLAQNDRILRQPMGTEYKKLMRELNELASKQYDEIPREQKCEFKKPHEKPRPYECIEDARLILDFGVGKAYVCFNHWIYWGREILPYT